MPSISAAHITMVLKAVLALLLFGTTGVVVINYDDYIHGAAYPSLHSPAQSRAVQFGSDLDLSQSFDMGIWHASNDKPTPTLPLKISYAAPSLTNPKPTPTLPPKRKAEAPHAPTAALAFSSFLEFIPPRQGASSLAIPFIWHQNLLGYVANFVSTLAGRIARAIGQHASSVNLVIICKTICLSSLMATAAYLIPRLSSSRKGLPLPTQMKQTLGKVTAIILCSFYDPKTLLSTVITFLEGYLNDQERLVRRAGTLIKEAIEREKTIINRKANQEFRRLRKVHTDEQDATFEQTVFATANIGLNFGPSLEAAKAEVRGRLRRFNMKERTREEIIGIFNDVLYSFTLAIAVDEAMTEERNTRYLTVIHDQDRLIDSLRLLHEYREQAFMENEELVRSLCRYDDNGNLITRQDNQQQNPWDKYSAEYDKFIVSPLDGPTALSMKISVSSAPFHSRPATILESDPHWQRFLASTAGKRSEQEVRLASHEEVHNEDAQESKYDIKDSEEEWGNFKDGSVLSDAASTDPALKEAENNLIRHEWKLACMTGHSETSKVSGSKHSSDIAPAITNQVSGDILAVWQAQEEEWAELPKTFAIENCEQLIDTLKINIACMKSQPSDGLASK